MLHKAVTMKRGLGGRSSGSQSNVADDKVPADQGPVVQSIVSLTSSLRGPLVKCFTTL